MKKSFLCLSMILVLSGAFYSCGGGGGGSITYVSPSGTIRTTHYTHRELAVDFVRRMEMNLGYSLDLIKTNTWQYDYIVVYDYYTDTYDAYWIGDYLVGDDLSYYLLQYNDFFYYDLVVIPPIVGWGEWTYKDYLTGVTFEDGQPLSRIPSALQEHFIDAFKRSKAQFIVDKYGLSHERAGELVTLTMNFKALSHKSALTEAEYDAFAMEAVGTSATELLKMAKEGDVAGGLEALKRAADKNGIGVEHAQTLLFEEFGLSLD